MARYEYRLVDVFTAQPFGGNPLAVFPQGDGLDPAVMQHIAAELNLSESVFVQRPRRGDCDHRARIFTPRRELPFAGHPTVGTAFVLDAAERVALEEGVTRIEVERARTPEGAPAWRMTCPPAVVGLPIEDRATVAEALGLRPGDLDPELPVVSASCGVGYLLVGLRDTAALGRAGLRPDAWARVIEKARVMGVMPFVRESPGRVRCRMFAPSAGVSEDPATGSACGPLGAFLAREQALGPPGPRAALRCEQGVEMGRPSVLHVEVEGTGAGDGAVRIAGESVAVGGGWLEV